MLNSVRGWNSRGYLPHYDDGTKLQLITYRLCDALPSEVMAQLREMGRDDVQRRQKMEGHLDRGYGSCLLRKESNAELVVRGWKHFDGVRYHLHAWCVMPNHVHVLIDTFAKHALAGIVQSQKSYTAKGILRQYPGTAGLRPAYSGRGTIAGGTLAVPDRHHIPEPRHIWYPDYFDRFIRDRRHYDAAVDYVHQNPVKAGLVARTEHWPWSSATRDHRPPARIFG